MRVFGFEVSVWRTSIDGVGTGVGDTKTSAVGEGEAEGDRYAVGCVTFCLMFAAGACVPLKKPFINATPPPMPPSARIPTAAAIAQDIPVRLLTGLRTGLDRSGMVS